MSSCAISLRKFSGKIADFISRFSTIELVISVIVAAFLTFISTISYSTTSVLSPDVAIVHYGFPLPLLEKIISKKVTEFPLRYKIVPALSISEDLNFLFEGALLDFVFFFVISFLIVRVAYSIRDEVKYRRYCKLS